MRVALVTGGSSGIGAMLAKGFVQAGIRTYIASRNRARTDEAAARLGELCIPMLFDAADVKSTRSLAAQLAAQEPRIDVLVNCAGATWSAPLEEFPESAFDKNWAVNVKTPFYLTTALLPGLRAAVADHGHASVINVGSSDGSLVSTWENYAYSASKAALHHLTRQLAERLARDRITVNCIAPGPFKSRMSSFVFDNPDTLGPLLETVPAGRAGTLSDAAGTALFLSSPNAVGITGQVIPLDGGWAASRR